MMSKTVMRTINLCFAVMMIMASCNEPLPPNPNSLGYDYFPLRTGDVRIYDVVRIDHNLDLTSDTSRYQLKEMVGNSFLTGEEESFRIERYIRTSELDEWQIDSVWSARINDYQAILVENNVPIIKLSFPISEDRRWDGNAMNSKEFDQFKMINLNTPYTVGGAEYSSTLEMVKEDIDPPIKNVLDDIHKEFYARDVGMIYRIDIDRNYCNPNECSTEGIIEFGLELEYTLIEYLAVE